jgi:DNA adenine methylase
MRPKPPISLDGGKSRLASKIVALFPEHHTYVEVFGGTGACLLIKQSSPVEVFNDVDGDIVNLFRAIRDPELRGQLQKACEGTFYARAELRLGAEGVAGAQRTDNGQRPMPCYLPPEGPCTGLIPG